MRLALRNRFPCKQRHELRLPTMPLLHKPFKTILCDRGGYRQVERALHGFEGVLYNCAFKTFRIRVKMQEVSFLTYLYKYLLNNCCFMDGPFNMLSFSGGDSPKPG